MNAKSQNIYGVDLDPQAVEVTKLSLLLKVLEGETDDSLQRQWKLFQERALPDLGNNIKCGNSLIDSSVFRSTLSLRLSAKDLERIKPFDWRAAFPEVYSRKSHGFDVVLGNPPYIRIQNMMEWAAFEADYYKSVYKAAASGNYDIYVVFLERGLELLSNDGVLGYILPHKFFNAQYGEQIRDLLTAGKHVRDIVHFGDNQVFSTATTYTCLLFLTKQPQKKLKFVSVEDIKQWANDGATSLSRT